MKNLINRINSSGKAKFIIITVILAVFLSVLTYGAYTDSMTSDEPVHISAGYLYTQGKHRFNFEHPPIINYLQGLSVRVFVGPNSGFKDEAEQYAYGEDFLFNSENDAQSIIFAARIPVVILTVLLAIVVFLFSKDLFGFWGGLISLIFIVTNSLVLAHGRLATTDMGGVFFLVLTIYLFYLFYKKQKLSLFIFTSIAAGLAVSAKHSGAIIIPVIIFLFLVLTFYKKIKIKQFFTYSIFFTIISLFILWCTYIPAMYSDILYGPYTTHEFLSGWHIDTLIARIVFMPVDYYMRGLSFIQTHNELGHMAFLNGSYNMFGWWYYFPLNIWYKTAIPTLIVSTIGFLYFVFKKNIKLSAKMIFLILPVGYFIYSLTMHINIGMRHIMLVYPFLFIAFGSLALIKFKNKILDLIKTIIILILVLWQVVVFYGVFPYDLSYFNEMAGGKNEGYLHLSDSSIDWGQDVSRIDSYMSQNYSEDYLLLTCSNHPLFTYYDIANYMQMSQKSDLNLNYKYYLIRAFCYHMPSVKEDKIYQKMLNTKPIDTIGGSILIYEFNND